MKECRTIVVTGLTRGLGRAMSESFVERGHIVIGCGRSKERIDEMRRTLKDAASLAIVDVASETEVKDWAERMLKIYGPPSLLINNAAVMNRNAPLWEITGAEFSQLIDVNIKGVANAIRSFVPSMLARKTGVIVNFSSGWGRSTSPRVAPYCASKWAIEGLTQALAEELPAGMAAVALNPGIINTEMLQACFGASAAGYPTAKRWAQTAAPFILGLTARYNGQSLTVAAG